MLRCRHNIRIADHGESWRQGDVYSQRLNRHIVFSPEYATDRTVFCGNYGGGVMEFTQGAVEAGAGRGGAGSAGSMAGAGGLGTAGSGATGGGACIPDPPTSPRCLRPHGAGARTTSARSTAMRSPSRPRSRPTARCSTATRASIAPWTRAGTGSSWPSRPRSASCGGSPSRPTSPPTPRCSSARARRARGAASTAATRGPRCTGCPGSSRRRASASRRPTRPIARCSWPAATSACSARRTAATTGSSSLGLTTLQLRCLAVSPGFAHDRRLFTGTVGHGIFVSHDGGDTWAPSNAGLPGTGRASWRPSRSRPPSRTMASPSPPR